MALIQDVGNSYTAKVDIYFDYSDETFETYCVHEPAQAIEFVISWHGFTFTFSKALYANGLFIDDKYSKGRQQVLFSKPALISAVETHYRNVLRVNQLKLDRLDAPFFGCFH